MCTLFLYFASLSWLCPWLCPNSTWGLLLSRRPGSTHFYTIPDLPPVNALHFEVKPVHSEVLGTPTVQTIPISNLSRLLAVAPPDTLG